MGNDSAKAGGRKRRHPASQWISRVVYLRLDVMIRSGAVAIVVFLSISAAAAQNIAAIDARQKIMKSFGDAAKPIAAMFKGSRRFDLAVVKEALATYSAGAEKLPPLFPEDARKGGDTEALPAIWDNKADFDKRVDKLGTDAHAALASVTDQASFSAVMPKFFENCDGCHKQYRKKK
jgi:cytochrome c556